MSNGQKTSAAIPASPRGRDEGNVLILGLLLATLVSALITAQVITVQKNARSSNWMNDHVKLRGIADSGIYQAVYELAYKVGKADGRIGTDTWVVANDLGQDAQASTGDEGEK